MEVEKCKGVEILLKASQGTASDVHAADFGHFTVDQLCTSALQANLKI
jgi:hypothetical protein